MSDGTKNLQESERIFAVLWRNLSGRLKFLLLGPQWSYAGKRAVQTNDNWNRSSSQQQSMEIFWRSAAGRPGPRDGVVGRSDFAWTAARAVCHLDGSAGGRGAARGLPSGAAGWGGRDF